jgi:hypothetical protein
MRWCARCGVPIDDGLLLCADCVPRHKLIQDATINLGSPITAVIDSEGGVRNTGSGGNGTTSKVKAYEVPSKGGKRRAPLRAVEKVQWINDRQRYERVVWLYDRRDRVYCETCFDLKTGTITWGPKRGALDDQAIHGQRGKN